MEHSLEGRGLYAFAELLEEECLAAKKARLYANTLFETAQAQLMERLAARHAQRFMRLVSLFGKGGACDE